MKAYQQTITVGTGYLSTTTLLDKYWPQFTATNNATLKFQEIKDYEKIPASVDLIECIYSQEPIPKQGFLFKKITTTPLQIAVPPENPLATKDKLTITDLNNQKVLILKSNILGQSKTVSTFLKIHFPNIHLASY
ncbi:hypothetical protein EQ500_13355, partial [Lactobacillus sp. XV13L]|nr:hypothetical protein [Lactobacillus sp. XV13L]